MTNEINNKIKEIADKCYDFIYKNNVDNWRQATSEPVDLFVNYCDEETALEIKSLQNDGYEEELFSALELAAKNANEASVN